MFIPVFRKTKQRSYTFKSTNEFCDVLKILKDVSRKAKPITSDVEHSIQVSGSLIFVRARRNSNFCWMLVSAVTYSSWIIHGSEMAIGVLLVTRVFLMVKPDKTEPGRYLLPFMNAFSYILHGKTFFADWLPRINQISTLPCQNNIRTLYCDQGTYWQATGVLWFKNQDPCYQWPTEL